MQTKTLDRNLQTTAKPKVIAGPPVPQFEPITEDAIRERACEIYQVRVAAGQIGDELSDWLQAERELKNQS